MKCNLFSSILFAFISWIKQRVGESLDLGSIKVREREYQQEHALLLFQDKCEKQIFGHNLEAVSSDALIVIIHLNELIQHLCAKVQLIESQTKRLLKKEKQTYIQKAMGTYESTWNV